MCAALGTLNNDAATQPIDLIKVRLQLQGELKPGQSAKYKGLFRGIWTVLTEEGVGALYRGVSASLAREATYSTIRMGLYEPIKNVLKSPDDVKEPLFKKILAGGIAGMTGAAISNPTDLLKVRLQAVNGPSINLLKMACDIVKREGIKGLYRGVGPTTQRAMLLTASQLPSYDASKMYLISSGVYQEGVEVHLAASMFAGVVCATVSAPIVLCTNAGPCKI